MSAVECQEGEKPTTCVMSFQDMSRLAVAEQRRDSAEALTSALVESAVDGIIVIDLEGDVELFNPAATRMFGYDRDEIMGRPVDVLVPAWRREALGQHIRPDRWSWRSGEIGVGREVEGRRKDGSTVPLFISVSEMHVGTARKFTCVAHDLTALRQAQREAMRARDRFELAALGALDALWEWSAEPQASFYLSDRFWELLEYRRGELPDSLEAFSSLVHPDDRDVAFHAMQERLALRAPFVVELRLRRKSGDYRWFRGHGQAVWGQDALPMRMAGSLSDITEERLAKEQLGEQKVLVELGKMAAVVVHEVRNPIAGVQGALDVLIGRRPEDDEERDIMIKMRRRLDSLSEMVGDLLVYSRPKPVNLQATYLRDVFDSVSSLAATTPVCAQVTLEVTCPDVILAADGPALGRALLNLVLNAAQAMRGRGRIAMSATASDDVVTIVVADTGPGMASGVRRRLFEPFYTTKKGGTGLGLCISKRIVEQHGGAFSVESELGEGTRIVLRLPAPDPALAEISSSPYQEAPPA
jgi:PAS domain S-box-containing protein